MIVMHLTRGGGREASPGGGTPTGLTTAGGVYPQINPECPGLSSFGEPLSCRGGTT